MPAPEFPLIDVDKRHGTEVDLRARGEQLPPVRHRHEARELHAINAALAAGRPLLIRGEPGTGKSQLARAAADLLVREFVWKVVDAQTQVSDLFFAFDAVERLAQAQVAAILHKEGGDKKVEEILDERNFVRPGPLWWAFDPASAAAQDLRHTTRRAVEVDNTAALPGHVVLIDEIDKTDPSVPSGLLEALGQGTFEVPRGAVSLHRPGRPAPLIVITTNQERELPAAFVRRCMVLHLQLPTDPDDLRTWLVARGKTHFPDLAAPPPTKPEHDLLARAADLVIRDRQRADELGVPPAGQAEYLDILRALNTLRKTNSERIALLGLVADFALDKHRDPRRELAVDAP